MTVSPKEKQILTFEIDRLDKSIHNYKQKIIDLEEKREAFELIRLAIWDDSKPIRKVRKAPSKAVKKRDIKDIKW